MTTPLRLVLCEDSPDIRLLLRHELADHGIEIVGESGSCKGCHRVARRHQPAVILLDLGLDEAEAETITSIGALARVAPVVVFSGFPTHYKAAECLAAGAAGYVEKGTEPAELAAAIHAAARPTQQQ